MTPQRLNNSSLHKLPGSVSVPDYARSGISPGIVHVGVGNFHRAHEAYYTDQLLNKGESAWGICGICLLEKDLKMYQTLNSQDGLYSLVVKEADGSRRVRVIGSIVEYLYAPSDPSAVIAKMADPSVRIISLTITEGGYNYDPATGQFNFKNPDIQWDLCHPDRPRTIFGYLTAAFRLRQQNRVSGLTVLSCDNIQQNGSVCRNMLRTYMEESMPELRDWLAEQVSFPNSMVDRITPVTTTRDVEELRDRFHLEDSWPVSCEPFIQWVIEDHFSRGRPPWEKAGVQFTEEVEPYEKMKIRLLNAGHSLLGFTGSLMGYSTIYEAVGDALILRFLRAFMDQEVTPILGSVEGIDLNSYKETLIQRFANPQMEDRLSRICSESSSKIPKFLIPTIKEQLERGGPVKCSALIIATWCRTLELPGTSSSEPEVLDVMGDTLVEGATTSLDKDPLAFLKIGEVFGNLYRSGPFVRTYLPIMEHLRTHGTAGTISHILKTKFA
jgi:mannitol 2-dehydrogenase